MTIRLVAVDEHVLLRLGLARVAAGSQDVELVGEASTLAEARQVIDETRANVITIDATLGGGDGITGACRLRAELPDLGIVVLSPVEDDTFLYRSLDANLSAYLTKASPASAVLAAIRHAAAAPHSFTAPGLASALDRRRGQHGLLSQRESEVLVADARRAQPPQHRPRNARLGSHRQNLCLPPVQQAAGQQPLPSPHGRRQPRPARLSRRLIRPQPLTIRMRPVPSVAYG